MVHAIIQSNVVVFADGQIDRSPCGSGTSAQLAVLLAQGEVSVDRHLIHDSILKTQFEAFVMASAEAEDEGEGEMAEGFRRVFFASEAKQTL